MSRASTEMEAMRAKMVKAVDLMSPENVRAMLLRAIKLASTFEMEEMARATSFESFENLNFELDLTT